MKPSCYCFVYISPPMNYSIAIKTGFTPPIRTPLLLLIEINFQVNHSSEGTYS
jgi:hypothetical protein